MGRYREQARSHRGFLVVADGLGDSEKTVGASLLAMALGQSASWLADSPLSRAGSLPQGIFGGRGWLGRLGKKLWERACSRRCWVSRHHGWLMGRYREQARSHRGFLVVADGLAIRKKLWERACSRWRRQIQHHGWLIDRYREQARSHKGALRGVPEPLKVSSGSSPTSVRCSRR
ncbi:hypothetical protein SAMN04490188_5197 [Pseudomonas kilonensis]|uniref:Transposase n=1 Tax=Pseudomonas kilonensis TaxID=132476 RepID=A0ABY0ZHN0_9PSED|nr:hypothetical protein SAMN04490188_5197 [Pseudomonas kilonensis]